MAKVKGNPSLIAGISGAIGGLVYQTGADGEIHVQRKPEREPDSWSENQLDHQAFFKAAAAYGNKIKLDPALAPLYQLVCKGRMRPFHAGLRDFLVSPTVEGIDVANYSGHPAGIIRVSAWDDFQVIQLIVLIRNAANQEIVEQGPA